VLDAKRVSKGRKSSDFGEAKFSRKLPVLHRTGCRPYSPAPMSIVINILLVIHVLVSLLIILLVLMQRPKNEGLGAAFGGGMTENLFGAQTTNVLQTITRWLGGIFFGLTLLLSYLYVKQTHQGSSIQRQLSAPTTIPAAATPAPSLPTVPGPESAPSAVSPPVKAEAEPLEKGTTPAAPARSTTPAPDANAPAPAPAPVPDPGATSPNPPAQSAPEKPAGAPSSDATKPGLDPAAQPAPPADPAKKETPR
jgi:preprotein translocase subunit SecG